MDHLNLKNVLHDVNYASHNIVDRIDRAFGNNKVASDIFKISASIGIPLALGYGLHRYVNEKQKLKEKIPFGQLRNGGNIITRVLNNHNIKFAFALNDLNEINTINESTFENKMTIIQMKNYNNAIVAASGVFRMTGQIGVLFVSSGPDVISMINSIIAAKYENIPLVVIGIKPILNEYYYDKKLLKSYFKFTETVKSIGEISGVLEESLSRALDGENANSIFVEISQSLLLPEEQTKEIIENYQKSRWYFNRLWDEFSGRFKWPSDSQEISFHYPKIRHIDNPKSKHVDNVLKKLLESKNPILIVGDQCLVSNNINNKDLNIESLKLSIQLLGIPTYLHGFSKCLGTMDIKNIVNDNLDYAIEHCDLLISIGISSPTFLQDLNINTFKTPVYSIEEYQLPLLSYSKLGMIDFIHRYACDPSGFLLHLGFIFPKAFTNKWNNWLFDLKEKDSIASLLIEKKGEIKVDHINPHLLIKSLKDTFKRLEKPPVIVSDKGEFCELANITLGGSVLSWVQSSKFNSHGSSIGLAIASKLCFPETDVFMLCDEKSIINCVQEFGTLSRYHLPINIIVGNHEKSTLLNIHNQDIVNLQTKQQQQLQHQQQMNDHSKFNENQRTAYHKIMNAYGGKGFIISHNDSTKENIENILFDAREKSNNLHRPVLINCWVDVPKNIIGSGQM